MYYRRIHYTEHRNKIVWFNNLSAIVLIAMAVQDKANATEPRKTYSDLTEEEQRAVDAVVTYDDDEVLKSVAQMVDVDAQTTYTVRSKYQHIVQDRRQQMRQRIADGRAPVDNQTELERTAEAFSEVAQRDYELDKAEAFDVMMQSYLADR